MGINEIIQVGNNIKKYRKEKNISQKDMAKKLNIPSSTYSNYENNNREPNAETLKKIASILDIKLEKLLRMENVSDENAEKYLSDNINTIQVIESLIKLCNFNINFNQLSSENDDELESSLKLAIENNAIPLTYISNGQESMDLTNDEFNTFADKILDYVKIQVNDLITKKSS